MRAKRIFWMLSSLTKLPLKWKATDVSAAENGKDSCYKPRYSTCIVLFCVSVLHVHVCKY